MIASMPTRRNALLRQSLKQQVKAKLRQRRKAIPCTQTLKVPAVPIQKIVAGAVDLIVGRGQQSDDDKAADDAEVGFAVWEEY